MRFYFFPFISYGNWFVSHSAIFFLFSPSPTPGLHIFGLCYGPAREGGVGCKQLFLCLGEKQELQGPISNLWNKNCKYCIMRFMTQSLFPFLFQFLDIVLWSSGMKFSLVACRKVCSGPWCTCCFVFLFRKLSFPMPWHSVWQCESLPFKLCMNFEHYDDSCVEAAIQFTHLTGSKL